jgi:hypothetical protein
MGSLDPYPDPDPGGQKWSTNIEKKKCWMFSFEAEGFSYSLDISKYKIVDQKRKRNFNCIFFSLQFKVIKTLDPDWIRIRFQIHVKCWIQ